MAINPLIAMSGQNIDVATPIAAYRERQRTKIDDDYKLQQLANAKIKNLDERQMSRLKSSILGASQLNTYLEAGDIEGARTFLQNRRTNLGQMIADGAEVDTVETDDAIKRLEQDPEGLKKLTQQSIKFGQLTGILKSPNEAVLGGATGQLINRLMAENPKLTFEDALFQVQTGNRSGVKSEGGKVKPITGLPESKKELSYAEKSGDQKAIKDNASDIEAEKGRGETIAIKERTFPQATAALKSWEARAKDSQLRVDELLPRINSFTAGWGGKQLSEVAGTDAADLRADIDTLLARSGFDELQAMRDNSPTGGALGSITENEIKFLQALKSNIQQSQSPEQLKTNLVKFQRELSNAFARAKDAYEMDFADQISASKAKTAPIESETKTGAPAAGSVVKWEDL